MHDAVGKKPLILLLGNYRPSLILARDFKRRGFEISVGNHGCERLCQFSSAVSNTWDHSTLDAGPSNFCKELTQYADDNPQLTAIIPVAEEYVRLFAEHEAVFKKLRNIVSMDSELILKCLDKEYMLNLAQSLDVATMPFAYTSGLDQAINAAERIHFPMILRPKKSTERIDGKKAISIENEKRLIDCFNSFDLGNQELLLQRKFEGKRHNIYFAAHDGEALRLLHAVIDRTDKIDDTGLAVEGRTLGTDSDLVRQTRKLLSALNYSGIGCAQYLVNEETGETSFLEINPRIAGNHALPEYAGMELGWFNYERVIHSTVSDQKFEARSGIRYSWFTGDLMGAKVAFLRGEIDAPTLLKWCLQAFATAARTDLHIVFSIRDPYPAIRGLWNVIPRIARWRSREVAPGENTIYSREKQRYS